MGSWVGVSVDASKCSAMCRGLVRFQHLDYILADCLRSICSGHDQKRSMGQTKRCKSSDSTRQGNPALKLVNFDSTKAVIVVSKLKIGKEAGVETCNIVYWQNPFEPVGMLVEGGHETGG